MNADKYRDGWANTNTNTKTLLQGLNVGSVLADTAAREPPFTSPVQRDSFSRFIITGLFLMLITFLNSQVVRANYGRFSLEVKPFAILFPPTFMTTSSDDQQFFGYRFSCSNQPINDQNKISKMSFIPSALPLVYELFGINYWTIYSNTALKLTLRLSQVCNSRGNTSWSFNCIQHQTKAILDRRCSNLQECTFQVTSQLFGGDPCPGTGKYIEVSFMQLPIDK